MYSYEELFIDERQACYDKAMKDIAPHARDQEFTTAIKRIAPQETSKILDFPSGGGYLQQHIKGSVDEIDPSQWNDSRSLQSLNEQSYDFILSIAGLHHYTPEQRLDIYGELHRVLKNGGELIISEVIAGSNIDAFLNVFVDKYNPQGHEGIFLNKDECNALENSGFKVSCEKQEYEWCFDDEPQMVNFFKDLFYLKKADHDIILEGIGNYLERRGNNVLWGMNIFHCVKSL